MATRKTFGPCLSNRAAYRTSGQLWRADDGTEIDGPLLAMRAFHYGWISPRSIIMIRWFLATKVGDVLKTGVSAYERIR